MRHTVNRQKVVLEHFDDETVLINMQTCVYYSLNRSGCEVWKLVEVGLSNAAIAATLSRRHAGDEAAIAAQVDSLLEQLVGEGLLEPASSEPASPSPADAAPAPSPSSEPAVEPFEAPRLARYHDMQDLLLLDPIHDVSEEAGWPVPKPTGTPG